MTILDRYLLRSILGGVALVMLVLLSLGALFLFIQQQDDIGVGTFGASSAMLFVVLNLPQQLFELMPIGALIGALLGLGALARGSELTVMRAAGISVRRIAGSAALAGLALMLVAIAVGEYFAPPLQQLARQTKAFGKYANVSFAGRGGAWIRDGNLLLNVEQQSGATEFGGMHVYELSGDHELRAIGAATRARAASDDSWRLEDYRESRFAGDDVNGRRMAERTLSTAVGGSFLGLVVSNPADIEMRSLARVIQGLARNDLETRAFEFAFWSRVARTVAIVFAVLLAVPFVFGTLRAAGSGTRTLIGLLLGIGFFLLQRMLESGAIVFEAPPMLLAWVPTLLMATLALTLIARVR
jgi:lipopolysaccharide export system permease protein